MNCKGQFSIIAALLVAVILIATVVVTYSTIRNSPIQDLPQVLSAIDETNLALKQVLGFTVGYYGSILQVSGNSTYAKLLATNYLQSGLTNMGNIHPDWGTSFNVSILDMRVYWFTNASYSMGNIAVNYSLTGLGMYGITYETSCRLTAQVGSTTPNNQTQIIVTKDDGEPVINLGKRNFKFYLYIQENSTWMLKNPDSEPTAFANGTYLIDVPYGVDPYSYVIQVEDPRGIVVVASSFSRYTCMLAWNSTLYSMLQKTTLVAELLQNGTIRWLGQNIQLTTQAKPIPPIPVKSIHVNQTVNNVSSEVPFQMEDWTSDYRIPLGLTNNASVFNSRTMLVFLVNQNVSKVTIWWDGSDTAVQTSYAYTNRYFSVNTVQRTLTNGILNLKIDFSSNSFKVVSTVVGTSTSSTAEYMRINNDVADYGYSEPTYAITNGTVRDVVQHEVEWGGGGAPNCPNVYAQIVLTLPANATYYTYQLRFMFVESQQKRNVTDLCPIKLIASAGQQETENGTSSGYPIVSSATGSFYNLSTSSWAHHWSQFNSSVTRGTGIMFTDNANQQLYFFDSIARTKTGALKVSSATQRTIELLPVTMAPANFTNALDITWHGAVATFDGTTPIYREQSGQKTGLWIIVEYPPTITITTES
jgi:hypothetical protein